MMWRVGAVCLTEDPIRRDATHRNHMSTGRNLPTGMTTRDIINRRVFMGGLNVLAMLLVALFLERTWKGTNVGMVGAITIGAIFGYVLAICCTRCLNCAKDLGLP